MNENSRAVITFCSYLCSGDDDSIKPLTPSEWSRLAELLKTKGIEPKDIHGMTEKDIVSLLECGKDFAHRLARLSERSAGLFVEVSRYLNMGIKIYTRADREYPAILKKKLGRKCPPLFYCAGNIGLLRFKYAGWQGSRNIDENDADFARNAVIKAASHGFAVVSGGAKGSDSVAFETALSERIPIIEYISCGIIQRLRNPSARKAAADGRILILSASVPEAGFNTGMAMSRNKYIYAQSFGSVIIKSELKKGGTWAGAVENLKNKWCSLFCRDINYPGNQELIRLGAIPVNENWDGNFSGDSGQKEFTF